MPNVEVKCTVANCVYHAKGNLCGADEITIDIDRVANIDTEFSEEFSHTRAKRGCESIGRNLL